MTQFTSWRTSSTIIGNNGPTIANWMDSEDRALSEKRNGIRYIAQYH